MRRLAAVLLSCLVLAGCASDWESELRFKVAKIEDGEPHPNPDIRVEKRVDLQLVGDLPKDALETRYFKGTILSPGEISGGEVKVGDEVVCTAKQHTTGAAQANTIETKISGCRKA